MVGRLVGSGGHYGWFWHWFCTVLYWFWHCSVHCPCPSMPYLALSDTSVYALVPAVVVRVLRVDPALPPRVHPCHHARHRYGRVRTTDRCRRHRGAQSGLQQGTDSLGSSPGPLLWPGYPADRHPTLATPCHLAVP